VAVLRDGRERTFRVRIAEREESEAAQAASEPQPEDLGLRVEAITPELARRLEIKDTAGLVVTSVSPASPAEEGGIQVGDVIRQVNRRSVSSVREYAEALGSAPDERPVLLLLERRGNSFFVALRSEN
jgi:serine protease Do